jgi:hypothetical protein
VSKGGGTAVFFFIPEVIKDTVRGSRLPNSAPYSQNKQILLLVFSFTRCISINKFIASTFNFYFIFVF